MLSLTEDSCGMHDTLVGGSTAESNLAKYGAGDWRNTRDNFILAAGKHGMTRRDIAPCISFFSPLVTDDEGRFLWRDGAVRAGDFVELRAEMNLIVALSNCPHPLSHGPVYAPRPVHISVRCSAPPPADDLCRTLTAEAVRGFENTDPLFGADRKAR
jgi:uncharacterized protein YcgI (DUF1989 family)